ncbi:hypothetical protein KA005_02865 [bacterium]|nr:hypothetical protein [bacterium]
MTLYYYDGVDPHWTSRNPFLDENYSNDKGIPTLINRGLFNGYSIDIWETPAKPFEELLFRTRVPHEWDGETCPWFVAITAPSATEDVNDKYKFQIEWQSGDIGAILPDTIQETLTSEVTLIAGQNTAWFAHIIAFEIDCTTLFRGQNMQWRLRRVAASANEVTAEPVVYHWDTRWYMDKLGTKSIQGYDG